MNDTTTDAFLNGKLQIIQPKQGYRAATDPVFLAAFAPIKSQESVLELGCGVGTASLCLGARVPGLALTGVEIQAHYAALARQNVIANAIPMTVVEGDVENFPASVREISFDHLIANPPYFEADAHSASPVKGKDIANRAADPSAWISHGLKRLKPGGWITVIQRSTHLAGLLSGLQNRTGDITILPLASRTGRPADRVLIRARKGSKGKLVLLPHFVIHDGDHHVDGSQGYSPAAEVILRAGRSFEF